LQWWEKDHAAPNYIPVPNISTRFKFAFFQPTGYGRSLPGFKVFAPTRASSRKHVYSDSKFTG
jgi:hypothetical protein